MLNSQKQLIHINRLIAVAIVAHFYLQLLKICLVFNAMLEFQTVKLNLTVRTFRCLLQQNCYSLHLSALLSVFQIIGISKTYSVEIGRAHV